MAKIGLNNFRYGILTEASDGTPSYGAAKTPGKAISCKVSITNNDATLYGDDSLIESDKSFNSVEFLYKVKFGEPSQENATKGDKVDFSTVEIEGTVNALANGMWSKAKTFDTKQEAVTYLEGLFKKA